VSSGAPAPEKLLAALEYADHGLPVLPVHSVEAGCCSCGKPDCSSPGNHPRTLHGVKNASKDGLIVGEWWLASPDDNIGIATGGAGGLLVLNIKGEEGAHSLKELEAAYGPLRPTVRTGLDCHLWFRLPTDCGPVPSSSRKLGKGIDVQADGEHAVAPPSIHSSSARYEFESGFNLTKIASVPDLLLQRLTAERAHPQEGEPQVKVDDLRIPDELKRVIKEIKSGKEPDELIFVVIVQLKSAGCDKDVIETVLLDPANGLSEKPREKGRAWLQGEIRRAPDKPSVPTATPSDAKPTSVPTPLGPNLVRMSDVEPEEVQWLFYPYIPLGKLTLIEGDPGLGKSRLTHAFAAAVSRGKGLLKGASGPSRPVLLLTMEDGLADTVRPHLDRLGADLSIIHAYNAPLTLDQKGLAMLERHIVEHRPGLVIIDPLQGAMGGKIDLHRANETRPFMAALAELASKHSCAIVCARHLTKGARDRAIYRGIGSIDITGAARSVLQVGLHPEDKARRVLAHAKSNLGPLGPSWAFTISDDGTFEWGAEVTYAADDLFQPSVADEVSQTARGEAVNFLREVLANGPVASTTIEQDAKAVGIAKRTLSRAKKMLGVYSRKTPDGYWVWILPEQDRQDGSHN
jgi:hypothetical protein